MRSLIVVIFALTIAFGNILNINRANVWVEDGDIQKSFYINGWSSSATVSANVVKVNNQSVTRLNSNSAFVLINSATNSYPKPTNTIPTLSIVGLSEASAALGEDMNASSVSISPNGGVFDKTIAVTISAIFGEPSKKLYYKINNEALKSVTLPLNGKKSITFYLAKDGDYNVSYGFNQNALEVANFKLTLADKKADSDGDGIPDSVEAELGLNPFDNTMSDSDKNGWSDFDEFIRDYNITDSDGDGWSDWDEVVLRGTNPNNANVCVDIDSKPFASTLYAIEYNITSSTIAYKIDRISVTNTQNNPLYDSLKVLAQNRLCQKSALTYQNELKAKKVPHIRFSAEKGGIARVVSIENNKTKVYKSWLNSHSELSPKTFKNSAEFANLPDNMSANDYKIAYINYLKSNLIKNITLSFDKNSTIKVALVEAAIRSRSDENSTVILGDPDFKRAKRAFEATKKAFSIYEQNFNGLYSNLESKFSNSAIFNEALNRFNGVDINQSTEELVASYLQNSLSERDKYQIALFTIVPKSIADSNTSVYNENLDSDSDALLNKDEVLAFDFSDPLNSDSDSDGLIDSDDLCKLNSDNECLNEDGSLIDYDLDGIPDAIDNCPSVSNPEQNSTLIDGVGDACAKKGIVITNPHFNKKVLQGEEVEFEAVVLNSATINNISWQIDGVEFSSATLQSKYQFNQLGTFEVCALDKNNIAIKSCVQIEVVKAVSGVDFDIYVQDVIEDDDNITVNYAVVEVKLKDTAKYDFNISYSSADISAIANSDYKAVNGNLAFKKGDIRQYIKILVYGDTINEGDEVFKIKVANKEKNITIIDNDFGVTPILAAVTIKEATFDSNLNMDKIIEGDSDKNFTINFSLAQSPTQAVSFDYEVVILPSSVPNEYNSMLNPISGTITFAQGEQSKDVKLLVYGDTINESDRVFKIKLSNPNGVKFYNDPQSVQNPNEYDYNVLLADNDPVPTLSFENSSYLVREGNSTTVKVRLSNYSYRVVEANITIDANSTALKDIDYKIYSNKVVIPATQPNSQTPNIEYSFNITSFYDRVGEGNESLKLSLSNLKNATTAPDKNSSTTIEIFEYPIEQALAFAFYDGVNGNQAWTVWPQNGYQTQMILNPAIGTNPRMFTYVDTSLFFIAENNNSYEALYISNGVDYTVKLFDINTSAQQVYEMFNINDELYVFMMDYDQNGGMDLNLYLYVQGQLIYVDTIESQTIGIDKSIIAVNEKLFITVANNNNSYDLMLYDTKNSIKQLVDYDIDFALLPIGNRVYYIKNTNELWSLEADSLATKKLYVTVNGDSIDNWNIDKNYLYFYSMSANELREVNLETNSSYSIDSVSDFKGAENVGTKLYYVDGSLLKEYIQGSQNAPTDIYTFANNPEVLELYGVNNGIIFKDSYTSLKSIINGTVNSIENLSNGAIEVIDVDINRNLLYKILDTNNPKIKKSDGAAGIDLWPN